MEKSQHTRHRFFVVVGMAVVLAGLFGLFFLPSVQAQVGPEPETAVSPAPAPVAAAKWETAVFQPDGGSHVQPDLACVLCHSDTDEEIEFPSGETLPAIVDLTVLNNSAHGELGGDIGCTGCHQSVNDYQVPHTPVTADSLRAYEVERSDACERCHQLPHLTSHPGKEAASPVTCTDCHGAHDVQFVEAWESGDLTDTCVNCHLAAEVELADTERLTPLIRSGLFADEVDNDYCLSCHSQPDLSLTFPNGDELSLTVDRDAFHASVHGLDNPWNPLNCTDCHEDYEFPHQPVTATSAREYSLDKVVFCAECHETNYENMQNDVHTTARIEEGVTEAAICTDCHGAHETPDPNEPRQRISQTCRQCHSTIYDEYADSVHGAALLEEDNPDVPTCIGCHGVHNISDPTTALFRVRSPQLCAGCHADEELMEQYDISTDVFETYVADFHGTTVTLFEHQDPTVETNKAVCYDCHGVHDIKDPEDPEAGIKANLLETCQQCHPNATENFSDSWTSHFRPSLEHNPLVFLVNLFYRIVIPLTVGFFGFMVFTDIYRKIRFRFSASEG